MDSIEFRTSKFVLSDKARAVSSDKVVEAVTGAASFRQLIQRRTELPHPLKSIKPVI